MSLHILPFVLGPLENNTYLLTDSDTGQSVVIDPSFNIEPVLHQITADHSKLQGVWLTHGHFDHFAGASQLIRAADGPADLLIHEEDLVLWQNGGEAHAFGIKVDNSMPPTVLLKDFQLIHLGSHAFKVLPTPGHTSGHVTFYCEEAKAAFCGDLVFRYSIGRTDLNGGDYGALMRSIETQILTMPPDTVLFSGHGENSTVEELIRSNPFVTWRNPRPGFPE